MKELAQYIAENAHTWYENKPRGTTYFEMEPYSGEVKFFRNIHGNLLCLYLKDVHKGDRRFSKTEYEELEEMINDLIEN